MDNGRRAMTLAGLALLAALAMGGDQDAPRLVVPNSPDLTIRLRADGRPAPSTVTIRLKGARQLRERSVNVPGAATFALVAQCDRRRMMLLNPAYKTYGYLPIETSAPVTTPRRGVMTISASGAGAGREEVVIDAVDTGERRQLGGLTARHIVTTTTTTDGKSPAPIRTRVQDGWYVDLPPFGCIEQPGEMVSYSLVSGGIGGVIPAPAHVTVRGRAKAGIALIETDRTTEQEGRTWEQRTELVEISSAPLDAALFDIPAGYRAALPYWSGGFDVSRPDTVGNRLSLLWEGMRTFASRWWP